MDATARRAPRWAALCLGAALALPALAQERPNDAEQPDAPPGQVLSDAEPLPAEHRDSGGALLLEQSPVRAQQQQFREAAQRTGITSSIGRNVSRLLERSRGWDDVREAEAVPLPQDGR
jgi:hypothetical protein